MTTTTPLDLDVDLDFGPEADTVSKQQPQDYTRVPLELLWRLHEEYVEAARSNRDEAGRITQELVRRARELRPDFNHDTGGTMEIAGESLVLTFSYDREYEYDPKVIETLPSLVSSKDLTAGEYGELVKYEPKVIWRVYQKLEKRGGKVGEVLHRMRVFKSAKPKFEPKERVA